jgi:hypothetical protein
VVILSCGNGDTADTAGVRSTAKVPAHGHSDAFDGGILKLAATSLEQSITQLVSAGSATYIKFDGENIDTLNTHSTTTNNTEITVPVGYNYAEVSCGYNAIASAGTANTETLLHVNRGGATYYGVTDQSVTTANQHIQTPLAVFSVSANDVIECRVTAATQNVTISSGNILVKLYR